MCGITNIERNLIRFKFDPQYLVTVDIIIRNLRMSTNIITRQFYPRWLSPSFLLFAMAPFMLHASIWMPINVKVIATHILCKKR